MLYTVKTISSPHNDEIKQLARLVQNSRERRKQDLMVLEGIHLTDAAWMQGSRHSACT
jgi:TrmH family RNA methyltransferase